MQEQAQAARKRAAGTMDEYTFIAEDSTAADRVDSAPAVPDVSAEQLYKSELAQELQVMAPCTRIVILHCLCCSTWRLTCKAAC